ncbi:hypothetical protein BS78_01G360900 [Paspalum vaginatum]|nr:hypothetical protein BS78_01G360900 [Paspalum vaginatum]
MGRSSLSFLVLHLSAPRTHTYTHLSLASIGQAVRPCGFSFAGRKRDDVKGTQEAGSRSSGEAEDPPLHHSLPRFEQHIYNHGRVGVHQGAEAEGGEAEPGDRLRARRPETQVLPDGDRGSPRRAGFPHQRVLRQELPGAAGLCARSLRRAGAQRPPGHRVLRRLLPPRGGRWRECGGERGRARREAGRAAGHQELLGDQRQRAGRGVAVGGRRPAGARKRTHAGLACELFHSLSFWSVSRSRSRSRPLYLLINFSLITCFYFRLSIEYGGEMDRSPRVDDPVNRS